MVLDGLVTGRRFSDGVWYLSALRDGGIERYFDDLSPRFVRVGTERILLDLKMAEGESTRFARRPLVHLCGMGDWYDLGSSVTQESHRADARVGPRMSSRMAAVTSAYTIAPATSAIAGLGAPRRMTFGPGDAIALRVSTTTFAARCTSS